MRSWTHATGLSVLLLAVSGAASGCAAAVSFPVASVHFEQNATDGDMEVVFEAKAGDDGLAELRVVSPDGRTVVDFNAPDSSTMGIRQFRFESPEPLDVASLKAAYPEGVYEFSGKSLSGELFAGTSSLSHRLPETVEIIRPASAESAVSVRDLAISWSAVEGVASYILEIEQDELNVRIAVLLPGSSTSFAVPEGFLLPDTEYGLGLATVTGEGNISFVETTFTTEK